MTRNPRQWSGERAAKWQNDNGWIVGCNFAPSTAGNQLEFWQNESYDSKTIDRELQWAAQLGMNAVRVYLHDLVFKSDPDGFLRRFEGFLNTAQRYSIKAIPVLFDGVWNPSPAIGKQPDPTPNLHNSMWVQGPGSSILYDDSRWNELRPYVDTFLSRFANDTRVLAWDLFNEPDQIDFDTIHENSRTRKTAAACALLEQIFIWGREIDPSQPLTVGMWEFDSQCQAVDGPMNKIALANCDVISFHCYKPRTDLITTITNLRAHQRPLLCTEWLARSEGSTVDLLEDLCREQVGAINWGLVDGRTQTRFPWRSWVEPVNVDVEWFHELLHADGRPYDPAEVELFRRVTGRK